MTDHAAGTCPYSWCHAHRQCTCPYAAASPHARDGCRYAHDDEPDDERHHA